MPNLGILKEMLRLGKDVGGIAGWTGGQLAKLAGLSAKKGARAALSGTRMSTKVMIGAGLGAWAATGDSGYAIMGAAAPMSRSILGSYGKKSPLTMGSMVAGVGIGALTGNPWMMPVGFGLAKGAGWLTKGTFTKGWGGAGGLLKGAGELAMFRTRQGVATLAGVQHPGWGGMLLGAGTGLGAAGINAARHQMSDPTRGVYPGGVGMGGRGGMPHDFLSTTGLSLSLHKRGRVTPRVV